jgi:hypothetical protein
VSPVWAEPIRRVWPRPSRSEVVLAVAWLALVMAENGNAIRPLTAFFTVLLGAFLLGAPWIIRLGMAVFTRIRLPRRVRWPARDAARWLAFPAALALAVAVPRSDIVFRLRFAASRNALEAIATSVGPKTRLTSFSARRAGLFWISQVEAESGVARLTTGSDAFGGFGVAFSPRSIPRDDPATGLVYDPLNGPWYRWSDEIGWRN